MVVLYLLMSCARWGHVKSVFLLQENVQSGRLHIQDFWPHCTCSQGPATSVACVQVEAGIEGEVDRRLELAGAEFARWPRAAREQVGTRGALEWVMVMRCITCVCGKVA